MKEQVKKKKAPYSNRIFIGISLMIFIGLLWLKYLPQHPIEIAFIISLIALFLLLKYR